jgi:prevent-host-death family protein
MAETITAREANQRFAEVLRGVEQGREFVVTKRGRPIARIAPVAREGARTLSPEQEAAWERLKSRKFDLGGPPYYSSRDELHER